MSDAIWKRWNWLDGALSLSTTLMYAAWFYPLLAVFLRDPAVGLQPTGLVFVWCLLVLEGSLVFGQVVPHRVRALVAPVGSLTTAALILFWLHRIARGHLNRWLDSFIALPRDTPMLVSSVVTFTGIAFLWWQGVRIAETRHAHVGQSFIIGAIVLAGLIILSPLLPLSNRLGLSEAMDARETRLASWQSLAESLAPIGLVVFPLSVFLALVLAGMALVMGETATGLAEWTIPFGLLSLVFISPVSLPANVLVAPVFLFVVTGLLSLSLLRVARTQRIQERRSGMPVHIERHWLSVVSVVVGGIVLVGVVSGSILAPFLMRLRYAWPNFSWWGQRDWDTGLWSWWRRTPVSASDVAIDLPAGAERLIDLTLLLGVVLIIWLLFLKRRQILALLHSLGEYAYEVQLGAVLERREGIFTWELMLSQLRAWLDRFRPNPLPPRFVDPGRQGDPSRVIRVLYQRLLARAIARGAPRSSGQTPLGYMHTLLRLWPGERTALETLTRAYIATRYGAVPPSPEQVQATVDAFTRVGRAWMTNGTQETWVDER